MKTTLIIALFLGVIFKTNCQYLSENHEKSHPTELSNSLEKLARLMPVSYHNIGQKYLEDKKKYGFIVENVQDIFPELVFTKNVNYIAGKNFEKSYRFKEVDHESLIPIMVASIKQLHAEIDKLKNEISVLKNEVNQ